MLCTHRHHGKCVADNILLKRYCSSFGRISMGGTTNVLICVCANYAPFMPRTTQSYNDERVNFFFSITAACRLFCVISEVLNDYFDKRVYWLRIINDLMSN